MTTYLCASHQHDVEVRHGTPLHVHDASYCDSPVLVGPHGPRLTELVLAAEAAREAVPA